MGTASDAGPGAAGRGAAPPPGYRWIALSNTTLGVLMASIDSSIVLISLPAIFRGIRLDPLQPGNVGFLLWMLMGYMMVTAVLVVAFGRVGDMLGRVRMYNLGFAVFTAGSILLSVTWSTGTAGAMELIAFRVVQGVGGALLLANSAAILTDAFPPDERGMALGINSVAAIAGSFVGLLVGGVLAAVDWRLVFLVSVPVGLAGTVWAYRSLRETGVARRARMDWWGNVTFAAGLFLLLIGITYGIQPAGGQPMGWGSPPVLALIGGGVAVLAAFALIEARAPEPLFRLSLFRIRAFAAGNVAGLLAAVGRGGLQFLLVIWLQGIWLPLHGFSYASTPLWAGIYMIPLTVGFLIAGPVSGHLSDRFGARLFATGGMLAAAATFALLTLVPADFSYASFAVLLLLNGLSMGLFISPNTAAVMNSVPPDQRGAASGMRATFQNAGQTLSIGLFFTLMIVGFSSSFAPALSAALSRHGVPAATAASLSHLSPVSMLFAAFLGYNPMASLLAPVLGHLPAASAAALTGRSFFPRLIAAPFTQGAHLALTLSTAMALCAAAASWLRGGRYVNVEPAAAGMEHGLPGMDRRLGEGVPPATAGGPGPAEAPAAVRGRGSAEVPGAASAAVSGRGPAEAPAAASGRGPAEAPAAASGRGPAEAPGAASGDVGLRAAAEVRRLEASVHGSGGGAGEGGAGKGKGGAGEGGAGEGGAEPAGAHAGLVVCISSAYGAGGIRIGPAVAKRLGLPFLDRAIPTAVAQRLAVSYEAALAHDRRARSGVGRMIAATANLLTVSGVDFPPYPPDLMDEALFKAHTEAVIAGIAASTGAVILGRAAQVILRSRPRTLRVRLVGPLEMRIRQAMALQGLDEAEARRRQKLTDSAREAYVRYLYGANLNDPRFYHLILDSTALPLDRCVDLICDAAEAAIEPRAAPAGA